MRRQSPAAQKIKPLEFADFRCVHAHTRSGVLNLLKCETGAIYFFKTAFARRAEGSTRALACSLSRPRGRVGPRHASARPTQQTPVFSGGAENHT